MLNSADIRHTLMQAFDDTGLVSLCQDHFLHLCNKFGDGMGKEQKLNIIIEHFLSLKNFEPLIRVLEHYYPGAYMFYLQTLSQANSSIQSAYELVNSYQFDMTNLVQNCIETLYNKDGIVGFVIPNYSHVFLVNFHKRLRHDIGRGKILDGGIFLIRPLHQDVDHTLSLVAKRLKLLQNQDVLLGIQADTKKSASDFWGKLNEVYQFSNPPNRLVVVMSVMPRCIPNGPIRLEPPTFGLADIHLWIKMVVDNLGWPDIVIDRWKQQMFRECIHDDQVVMDCVFQHIEDMAEILKSNPSPISFQQKLETRLQYYA